MYLISPTFTRCSCAINTNNNASVIIIQSLNIHSFQIGQYALKGTFTFGTLHIFSCKLICTVTEGKLYNAGLKLK